MRFLAVVVGMLTLLVGCSDTGGVDKPLIVFINEPPEAIVEVSNPTQPDVSTVRLAGWNIRIFSDGSRDDDELQSIANVLIGYDFIAITELRDERVLERTENILIEMGRDYDWVVSEPVGNKVKERYAFLYDESLFSVVADGEFFPDNDDAFLREPYYASFRVGQFDFTAIAMHVIWGDRVAQRRAEIQALANVYNFVQASNGAEQDVLLFGDFNREPDDSSAYQPLLAIQSMTHLFQLPDKSHIKDSSLYDNIFFQTAHVTEYANNKGINRFDETDFANDDKAASLAVSDHRPVWGNFGLVQMTIRQ